MTVKLKEFVNKHAGPIVGAAVIVLLSIIGVYIDYLRDSRQLATQWRQIQDADANGTLTSAQAKKIADEMKPKLQGDSLRPYTLTIFVQRACDRDAVKGIANLRKLTAKPYEASDLVKDIHSWAICAEKPIEAYGVSTQWLARREAINGVEWAAIRQKDAQLTLNDLAVGAFASLFSAPVESSQRLPLPRFGPATN